MEWWNTVERELRTHAVDVHALVYSLTHTLQTMTHSHTLVLEFSLSVCVSLSLSHTHTHSLSHTITF